MMHFYNYAVSIPPAATGHSTSADSTRAICEWRRCTPVTSSSLFELYELFFNPDSVPAQFYCRSCALLIKIMAQYVVNRSVVTISFDTDVMNTASFINPVRLFSILHVFDDSERDVNINRPAVVQRNQTL